MMTSDRQVWFSITIYRPRRDTLLACLSVAVAALLIWARCPSRLLAPELWAEDGDAWLQQAYDFGLSCLKMPLNGHLQTLPRATALVAVHLPLTAAPLMFAAVAFVVQLAPVALLFSARGKVLIPNLWIRFLLVSYYIGEPNASEVHVNLTNAMWHLSLVTFLIVVFPKPKTKPAILADVFFLIFAGLSGPFALFITPVAWWHVAVERTKPDHRKRVLYAIILSLCAIIEGWSIITQGEGVREQHLGASLNRLVHILANQIFLGGMLGSTNLYTLMDQDWWVGLWPAASCCLLALGFAVYALRAGPALYRQFLLFCGLIMVSALASPVVSPVGSQWQSMQYLGVGDRYYVLPMLGWFATLLVVATHPSRSHVQWGW
ncbi:MAG TPA: hypothetical protein PLT25_07595 [Acidocella sp.]|nr:hypothetical protein [Acidocella sp.]